MTAWTDRDKEFVWDNVGRLSIREIARQMDRPVYQVADMAETLGRTRTVKKMLERRHHGFLHRHGYADYSAYLEGKHWRRVRAAYPECGLPQRCLICIKPRYELHHRTYDRLCRERLIDLIPLCHPCHERVHAAHSRHGIALEDLHILLAKAFGWNKRKVRRRMGPYGQKQPRSIAGLRECVLADPLQEALRLKSIEQSDSSKVARMQLPDGQIWKPPAITTPRAGWDALVRASSSAGEES